MESNITYIIMIIAVILFAMNMGASNIVPSFAAIYGAKLISHKKACFLFTIFVFLGAILLGRNVTNTLGENIVPSEYINFNVALFMILASTSGLFLANILKIPESTSWTTVFAISGVGVGLGKVKTETFLFIIPFWIILPIISYFLTYFLYRVVYPPKRSNIYLYEKLFYHSEKIKKLGLICSCYVAFACGTNNVANAVGPLFGANLVSPLVGLCLISPVFGLGALLAGKRIMTTIGKEIVPLGSISSSLISFITASLLIFASILGLPQSLVQLNALSIFAVSSVKNGHAHTINHSVTKKTLFVWVITPILAFLIGFSLVKIFI